jgi:DNA-binding GntR family transcriptional regulator
MLRLAQVAEMIDVSVTPVREALLLLAQDGWVVQEPHRGFRVASIRRSDVEDAYLVHSFLAGELTARAARRIDARQMAKIWACEEEIRRASWQDTPPQAPIENPERLNTRLHALIYETADAPRLGWFVTAASRFVPRRYWGLVPGWFEFNRTTHGPVLEALEARNEALARQLMSEHIQHAGELLLAYLDSIGYWEQPVELVGGRSAPAV